MTSRRKLLLALGAGTLSAALPSLAQQQGKVWRVGLVHVGNDHEPPSYKPLLDGMSALGYEDGRNIRYDFRNVPDEAAAFEASRVIVEERVDLIVAFDNEACEAARKATTTVPIVMINASNPVAAGFAQSLARPGGNMTGFAGRSQLPAKEMEFLREIAPKLSRVLLLYDSHERDSMVLRSDSRAAAKHLRFSLMERDASDAAGIRRVFDRLKLGDAAALLFASSGLPHRHMKFALGLAQSHKLLVVARRKDVVEQGALFSYSYDFAKVGRAAAARYVDRLLKGTSPRDLPIEEVTEYVITVNRGVAKRAGLTIPQSILLLAERVIE